MRLSKQYFINRIIQHDKGHLLVAEVELKQVVPENIRMPDVITLSVYNHFEGRAWSEMNTSLRPVRITIEDTE